MNIKQSVNQLGHMITIPVHTRHGTLIPFDHNHIPFFIKRVYTIQRVPAVSSRGFHSHKKTHQVIFCLQGNVTLHLDNGTNKKVIRLSKPNKGVYIQPFVWHTLKNFSPNTILLVLASTKFNESDYIRDYNTFLTYI